MNQDKAFEFGSFLYISYVFSGDFYVFRMCVLDFSVCVCVFVFSLYDLMLLTCEMLFWCHSYRRGTLLNSPTTMSLVSSKITTVAVLAISQLWCEAGFRN